MWNKSGDIGAGKSIAGKNFVRDFCHFANGIFEHCCAVLMDKVHFLLDRFVRRRMQAPAARHVERASSGAIYLMNKVDQTELFSINGRLEKNRSGAITEDDAGSTIGIVDDR